MMITVSMADIKDALAGEKFYKDHGGYSKPTKKIERKQPWSAGACGFIANYPICHFLLIVNRISPDELILFSGNFKIINKMISTRYYIHLFVITNFFNFRNIFYGVYIKSTLGNLVGY